MHNPAPALDESPRPWLQLSRRASFALPWMLMGLGAMPASAGALLPGDTLERALAVRVTSRGFEQLGDALGRLLPRRFEVADLRGEFLCADSDATPLSYALSDLVLDLSVEDLDLVPSEGRLDLFLDLRISGSASELELTGDCSFIIRDMGEVCGFEIPTASAIPLGLHLGLELALLDGALDATVDDVTLTLGRIENPISDCFLGDLLDLLLSRSPDLIRDILWGYLEPEIATLGPSVEEAIEALSPSLAVDTSVALGDAELALSLRPSALLLAEDGLLLGYTASITPSTISACAGKILGSETSEGPWPADADFGPDAATSDLLLLVSRDLVNHLLYDVWATGLLCLELDDLGGAPLSTELLGSLMGPTFASLFPEEAPASLRILAPLPPHALFGEAPPLRVLVEDLDLRIQPVFEGRLIRIGELVVDGEIALELPLADGVLTPALVLDPSLFVFEELDSELLPAGYSDGIVSFLPTAIGSFLPADLLPAVAIPSFQGIGLGSLTWTPSDDGNWLAGLAVVDASEVEPLVMKGCAGGGCEDLGGDDGLDLGALLGCSDAGCGADAGCGDCGALGPRGLRVPGRALGLVFLGLLLLARRRGEHVTRR